MPCEFDWYQCLPTNLGVITGYLLIKQFKRDRLELKDDDVISRTMHSDNGSILSHTGNNQMDILSSYGVSSSNANFCQLCGISLANINRRNRNDVEMHPNEPKSSYWRT